MTRRLTAVSILTSGFLLLPLLGSRPGEVEGTLVGTVDAASASIGAMTASEAEALAEDLAAMGRARGWTERQTAEFAAAEGALDSLTTRLVSEFPAAFVGSVLPTDPAGRPTVYIKGKAPGIIVALAGQLGIDLVDGQPHSLADNDERLAEVQQALGAAGITDMAGWSDIRDRSRMTVVVAGVPATKVDAALAELGPDVASDVSIDIQPGPIVEDHGAFGGMKLQDGGVFECTSGWTVQHLSTGHKGVTGAGHCAGIHQVNHPGDAVHFATLQQGHVGEWGDVEWYTTAEAEADDFYFNEKQRHPRCGSR